MASSQRVARRRLRHEHLEDRLPLTGVSFSSALPISPIATPTVGSPTHVSDFDRDGDLDVAFLETNRVTRETRVRLLINTDGRGEFEFGTEVTRFVTESRWNDSNPTFVDVDNDGDDDLFYTDVVAGDQFVYWSRNDGGLFSPVSQLVENTVDHVRLAELNNDGLVELIHFDPFESRVKISVVNAGQHQVVSEVEISDAEGALVETWFGATVTWEQEPALLDVQTADIDLDGDTDLLVSHNHANGSKSIILENLGGLEFSATEITETKAVDVFADVDGDGDVDAIVATDGEVAWLENTGQHEWVRKSIVGLPGTVDFVDDVDLDGDLDVALHSSFSRPLYYRNDNGTFVGTTLPEHYVLPASRLHADFDGDGDVDELFTEYGDTSARIKENSDGAFITREIVPRTEIFEPHDSYTPQTLVIHDLDGDLDPDVSFQSHGQHFWYANSGAGQFANLELLTETNPALGQLDGLADLDGDGLPDKIVVNRIDDYSPFHTQHLMDWFKNQNGTFEESGKTSIELSDSGSPTVVSKFSDLDVLDVDGDDDLDLWFRLYSADFGEFGTTRGQQYATLVYFNDGAGDFSGSLFDLDTEPFGSAHGEFIDLNGDGLRDWVTSTSGQLGWFENQGDGQYGSLDRIADSVAEYRFADVNDDGLNDAVVTKLLDGNVILEWHLNSASGFSSPIQMDLGDQSSQHFHLADLDADGTWEAITADRELGLLAHEFDPEGIVTFTVDAGFDSIPYSFGSADVDGDGFIDLAVATGTAVWWYQNLGPAVDIDSISEAIQNGSTDSAFDFDANNIVDQRDRCIMIEDVLGTRKGDANLDRSVSFADYLILASNFGANGGWSEGDFDGNGMVEFADFLLLSNNFGFTA